MSSALWLATGGADSLCKQTPFLTPFVIHVVVHTDSSRRISYFLKERLALPPNKGLLCTVRTYNDIYKSIEQKEEKKRKRSKFSSFFGFFFCLFGPLFKVGNKPSLLLPTSFTLSGSVGGQQWNRRPSMKCERATNKHARGYKVGRIETTYEQSLPYRRVDDTASSSSVCVSI